MKKFASIIIMFAFAIAATIAHASSAYVMESLKMAGVEATITAIKSGVKKAIKVTPSVKTVSSTILKGGGAVAVGYAVSELVGEGIDWVLDPANNRIRYNVTMDADCRNDMEQMCRSPTWAYTGAKKLGRVTLLKSEKTENYYEFECLRDSGERATTFQMRCPIVNNEAEIPIEEVAAKVIENASSGHKPSQDLLKDSVMSGFNAGVYDPALDEAQPYDGTNANEGEGTGTGTGTGTGVENPSQPNTEIDTSSIIAAINSLATSMTAQIAYLADVITGQETETRRVINTSTDQILEGQKAVQDVIGSNTDRIVDAVNGVEIQVGSVVGAVDAVGQKVETQGRVISDSVDRVTDAVNTGTHDVVGAVDSVGQKVDAQGQVISDSVDRVTDAVNTGTQSITDKVGENVKSTDRVGERIDDVTRDTPDGKKLAIDLPTFCDWATKICEFVDWATADPQLEPPDDYVPEVSDVSKFDNVDIRKQYINSNAQCPPSGTLHIYGGSVELSYLPLCTLLEKLAPIIVACAYLSGAYIILRG